MNDYCPVTTSRFAAIRNWIAVDDLLDRCLDNEELANRAIQRFHAGLEESARSLKTLSNDGDLVGLASQAHRLRGAAANVGCSRISEQAAQLEEFATQRLHDGVVLAVDLVVTTCLEFVAQVGSLQESETEASLRSTPSVD